MQTTTLTDTLTWTDTIEKSGTYTVSVVAQASGYQDSASASSTAISVSKVTVTATDGSTSATLSDADIAVIGTGVTQSDSGVYYLPTGTYMVTATNTGYDNEWATVTVSEATDQTVTITMTAEVVEEDANTWSDVSLAYTSSNNVEATISNLDSTKTYTIALYYELYDDAAVTETVPANSTSYTLDVSSSLPTTGILQQTDYYGGTYTIVITETGGDTYSYDFVMAYVNFISCTNNGTTSSGSANSHYMIDGDYYVTNSTGTTGQYTITNGLISSYPNGSYLSAGNIYQQTLYYYN